MSETVAVRFGIFPDWKQKAIGLHKKKKKTYFVNYFLLIY